MNTYATYLETYGDAKLSTDKGIIMLLLFAGLSRHLVLALFWRYCSFKSRADCLGCGHLKTDEFQLNTT